MSPNEYDIAVAAFIRNKSIKRSSSACGLPTPAGVAAAGRAALADNAAEREWLCDRRLASRERSFRSFAVPGVPGE